LDFGSAIYFANAGEMHAMFESSEAACRQRDMLLHTITFLGFFDPYRTEPRFQTFLARIHPATV
jgi:hypothetical protein